MKNAIRRCNCGLKNCRRNNYGRRNFLKNGCSSKIRCCGYSFQKSGCNCRMNGRNCRRSNCGRSCLKSGCMSRWNGRKKRNGSLRRRCGLCLKHFCRRRQNCGLYLKRCDLYLKRCDWRRKRFGRRRQNYGHFLKRFVRRKKRYGQRPASCDPRRRCELHRNCGRPRWRTC